MEREMISKKDLLELKGISYGQLYRWKRKKLLPEEWFVKKSSYTGQETFFPKEAVLKRIDMIIDLKDRYSLDELADIFSANSKKVSITRDDLATTRYFSQYTLELLKDEEMLSFSVIAKCIILEEFKRHMDIPNEKGNEIWNLLSKMDLDNKHYIVFMSNQEQILIKEESAEIYYEQDFGFREFFNSYQCKERVDEIVESLGGMSNE
ncbi:DUF4004 family protein [Vallitalea okinawensis]|uniref:DUF4004 family protein n=1 Tax=Vallitalea okinawensis TaxID=2078660 RepID=UPI000CFDF4F1|nr:DUF4004 family protein [Vallitalea okinawensis]